MTAHVAGMPVEELLPMLGGAAAMMAAARAYVAVSLRRGLRGRDTSQTGPR